MKPVLEDRLTFIEFNMINPTVKFYQNLINWLTLLCTSNLCVTPHRHSFLLMHTIMLSKYRFLPFHGLYGFTCACSVAIKQAHPDRPLAPILSFLRYKVSEGEIPSVMMLFCVLYRIYHFCYFSSSVSWRCWESCHCLIPSCHSPMSWRHGCICASIRLGRMDQEGTCLTISPLPHSSLNLCSKYLIPIQVIHKLHAYTKY